MQTVFKKNQKHVHVQRKFKAQCIIIFSRARCKTFMIKNHIIINIFLCIISIIPQITISYICIKLFNQYNGFCQFQMKTHGAFPQKQFAPKLNLVQSLLFTFKLALRRIYFPKQYFYYGEKEYNRTSQEKRRFSSENEIIAKSCWTTSLSLLILT